MQRDVAQCNVMLHKPLWQRDVAQTFVCNVHKPLCAGLSKKDFWTLKRRRKARHMPLVFVKYLKIRNLFYFIYSCLPNKRGGGGGGGSFIFGYFLFFGYFLPKI